MKRVIAVLSLIISELTMARTLDTEHYRIVVSCLSPKLEIGCERVSYQGVNKETGSITSLFGRQIVQACPDKVSSCYSLGYEFADGQSLYHISEDGQLRVTNGSKVVIDEYGHWTYE